MHSPADRDELDRLVVDNLPTAVRFARRLTGCPDEAEEVVQEALAKVLKQWPGYRGEASFSTWMFALVLNVVRDRHRRRPPPESLAGEVADGGPSSEALVDASELAQRVREAIDQLPGRQREVAVLCLVEHLSAAEAAGLLGTTVANVHTTLHMVRKKLLSLFDFAHTSRHE